MALQPQAIIEQVLNKIGHFRKILVGFSGALIQPYCCMHFTKSKISASSLEIRAIHIHHGLNVRADDWEAHCQHLCEQWHIPFVCTHVTVDPSSRGIEAAAREARYQAYRNELAEGEIIATAQHLDDQAETFMLALKRGSGPAGLSSMPELSPFYAEKGKRGYYVRY